MRRLMRHCDRVALATVGHDDSHPFASLAAVATDYDGTPVMLLSSLAEHSRNLAGDPRASLLFVESRPRVNPQTAPRASLLGRLARDDAPRLRDRYLARHPSAAGYASFADFATFRLQLERVQWIGGFGKAMWIPESILLDAAPADRFAAETPAALARLAADADLSAALGRAEGGRGAGWRIAGLDPDGADLVHGSRALRLAFSTPVASVEEAVAALGQMARRPNPAVPS